MRIWFSSDWLLAAGLTTVIATQVLLESPAVKDPTSGTSAIDQTAAEDKDREALAVPDDAPGTMVQSQASLASMVEVILEEDGKDSHSHMPFNDRKSTAQDGHSTSLKEAAETLFRGAASGAVLSNTSTTSVTDIEFKVLSASADNDNAAKRRLPLSSGDSMMKSKATAASVSEVCMTTECTNECLPCDISAVEGGKQTCVVSAFDDVEHSQDALAAIASAEEKVEQTFRMNVPEDASLTQDKHTWEYDGLAAEKAGGILSQSVLMDGEKMRETLASNEPALASRDIEAVSDEERSADHCPVMEPKDDEAVISLACQLSQKYESSLWKRETDALLEPILIQFEQQTTNAAENQEPQFANSFSTQLYYLSRRTILTIIGNPLATIIQFSVMIFFGFVVGGIFFQLDLEFPSGIQDRTGAFFFIIVLQMFGNLSAVDMFIKDRKMFMHESLGGFYRVSAYFIAKLSCDTIPMRFIPLIGFALLSYFMMGLRVDPANFFVYFCNLFLLTMSSSAIGFLISASVSVPAVANLVFAGIYVTMCIFGGYLVNLTTMVPWIRWMQYTSIIRFSLNCFTVNELEDQNYYILLNNGTKIPFPKAGNWYMNNQGIPYGTEWALWQNIQALGFITVGLFVLTYVQLRRLNKLR